MRTPTPQNLRRALLVTCVLSALALPAVQGRGWAQAAAPTVSQPAPTPSQPAPTPSQPALSLQELFRLASPAVVFITQVDATGKTISLGSGFVVSPSGVIITNNHVIAPKQGAAHLNVRLLPRGDVFTDVRVIYTEVRHDFAVLSTEV